MLAKDRDHKKKMLTKAKITRPKHYPVTFNFRRMISIHIEGKDYLNNEAKQTPKTDFPYMV